MSASSLATRSSGEFPLRSVSDEGGEATAWHNCQRNESMNIHPLWELVRILCIKPLSPASKKPRTGKLATCPNWAFAGRSSQLSLCSAVKPPRQDSNDQRCLATGLHCLTGCLQGSIRECRRRPTARGFDWRRALAGPALATRRLAAGPSPFIPQKSSNRCETGYLLKQNGAWVQLRQRILSRPAQMAVCNGIPATQSRVKLCPGDWRSATNYYDVVTYHICA